MVKINRYDWRTAPEEERRRVITRSALDISEQMEQVAPILARVRSEGDAALSAFTREFDGVAVAADRLAVTAAEIARAEADLDADTKATLRYAHGNIRKFHAAQMPAPMWMMEIERGVMAGEKVTPVSDVALYVPRGKGSFPSVLLMLGTPATVAGVARIGVFTPPNERGEVDPAILYAAHLLGIREMYRVGGPHAVAAAAYGTETIRPFAKIVGPGNPYVTAAKRLLAGIIDPGVPAGPSEAVILCDEAADPRKAALDLLIEAEHGPDSAALLVTHSRELADRVEAELAPLVARIESANRRSFAQTVLTRYGGIVLTENLEESVAFVNAYAPEHLEVLVRDPFAVLPQIEHAGEILLGEHTPITLCNFLLGPNAILPTGRHARTVSAVSIHDFLKRSSIGYATAEGFARVRDHAARFADVEGFETHARAVRER